MKEPIQKLLAIAGNTLEFEGFDILGILGFDVSILSSGETSLYEVQRQNFSVQVDTKDVIDNSIEKEMSFKVTNGERQYTLQLDRPPVDNLSGWSQLYCNLVETEAA